MYTQFPHYHSFIMVFGKFFKILSMVIDRPVVSAAAQVIVVCLRLILVHTLIPVSETHVPVTPVGTVNVSALLSLPIPKPVMKLEPALNGELQTCVVCTVTFL